MTTDFYIPALYCPFADEVHPRAAASEQHTIEWMNHHALVTDPAERHRFEGSKIAWLAARTAPHADGEFLDVLADWMMWLFAFDDAYSEETEAGHKPGELARLLVGFLQILEIPQARTESGTRFTESLRDVRGRLGVRLTPGQLLRFTGTVKSHFFGLLWEAAIRAGGMFPTIEEYLLMRLDTSAVSTCIALADAAIGVVLPDEELARADIRSLTTMAVNVTCWANDIYSYRKEEERSADAYNLPKLIIRKDGVTPQEALVQVARMHDKEIASYLVLEEEIRSGASAELRSYLDGLRTWMRGNLTWSQTSARYGTGRG